MTTAPGASETTARGDAAPELNASQLSELLGLLKTVDSVELKFTVPDSARRSAVESLAMDPLDAQIRQVYFFDTPDLRLNAAGVVLRARRIQGGPGDTVVKLRPVDPARLDPELRAAKGFGVEVDAMPGGFVCSGSMKASVPDALVKDVAAARERLRKLFSKPQRRFFAAHAPAGLEMDDLSQLGPVTLMKLKFTAETGRKMVAELWFYPDGSRILELSTKCAPADTFQVAAESKVFLAGHGLDLGAHQQTKTRTALEFFAGEMRDGDG